MLHSWYRRLPKRPLHPKARPSFRPQVLALEERVVPSAFTEVEPNNTVATANNVSVAEGDILAAAAGDWLNISGTIGTGTDVDVFRFTLPDTSSRYGVFFDLDSRETGLSGTLNGFLAVFNSAGSMALGSNDNGFDFLSGWPAPFQAANASSADSALYMELNPGTYLVRVSSMAGTTGSYNLRLLADANFTSAVPVFNSNPGAPATVFLDFDGHSSATDVWAADFGPYTVAPFDYNGNGSEWSPAERLAISNIWRVAAEDLAPFRVNVSTNYSGPFTDRVGWRQVIGNSNGAQFDRPPNTLGAAFLNGFAVGGSGNNTAFTFASNFTDLHGGGVSGQIMARAVRQANTSSHEAGHGFGLRHFTTPGQEAALMFVSSPGLRRATWYSGLNEVGAAQDDLAIIQSPTNGFGYRVDDYGSSTATASPLTPSGDTYSAAGIIERLTDLDYFRFSASGPTTITAYGDSYVNNLDIKLRLFDAAGSELASADPSGDFNASITMDLPEGTYYAELSSHGGPGEVGRYNLFITTGAGTPEIEVLVDGTDLPDGSGFVSFGNTAVGVPAIRTFVIRNVGGGTLTFGPTLTVPAGFSLVSGVSTTSLTAGQQTSFTLRMTAAAAGVFVGQVSLPTNDDDENPFNFSVGGTVGTPPTVVTLDDGNAGFFATPGFSSFSGEGYLGDVSYAAPGAGGETATWTFAGLIPGVYRVSATWTPDPNRATNAPYTVIDGTASGKVLGTVLVDQETAPEDFTASGVGWRDLGNFTIGTGTITIRLSDLADEFVIADGVRFQRLTSVPAIEVSDGPVPVLAGGTVDFGSTPAGTGVIKTFTVTNTGSAPLFLGEPISVPPGFTVVSSFGLSPLAPGASTTFSVLLDASSPGVFAGTLSFATNVAGFNPFAFTVAGTVTAPSVVVIDDGDAGFSATPGFFLFEGQGFNGDVSFAAPGFGGETATWTFTGLLPGIYRVSATWTPDPNRASNASYTVFNGTAGGKVVGAVLVNQETTPGDFFAEGVGWGDLGFFVITDGTLTVQLSDLADEYVIADALRIELLGDMPIGGGGGGAVALNFGPADPFADLPLAMMDLGEFPAGCGCALCRVAAQTQADGPSAPAVRAAELAVALALKKTFMVPQAAPPIPPAKARSGLLAPAPEAPKLGLPRWSADALYHDEPAVGPERGGGKDPLQE